MPEPEPRFGKTFGFALVCQGSVLPEFARFLPRFAPFLPEDACFLPGFARFRPVLPVSPGLFGFVQIHQDSFGFVRPLVSAITGTNIDTVKSQCTGVSDGKNVNSTLNTVVYSVRTVYSICTL